MARAPSAHYSAADAQRFCERHSDSPVDVAMCAYVAQTLAANPLLPSDPVVLSSVKSPWDDGAGQQFAALVISPSNAAPTTLSPAALLACDRRLLERLSQASLGELSDAQLVWQLRRTRLTPGLDVPPPQALLHAAIDAKHVAFVQAGIFLQLLTQPDSRASVEAFLGPDTLFVPYVSGNGLPLSLRERWQQHRDEHGHDPSAVALDKRGVVCWGDDAQQTIERMGALLTQADKLLSRRIEPVSLAERRGEELHEARRAVALSVRGALRRASGKHWIARWRNTPEVLSLMRRPDLLAAAERGCASPEHAVLTKRRPLVLHELAGLNPQALAELLDAEVSDFAVRYAADVRASAWAADARVDSDTSDDGEPGDPLSAPVDAWPRAVLVRDIGLLCLEQSWRSAERVANLYSHTIEVIEGAVALGGYQPLGQEAMIRLEHATLARAAYRNEPAAVRNGPLAGRVALVTDAGSGIGLATSRAMLLAGAHVMICDSDERVLDAVSEWPEEHFPGRFAAVVCDESSDRSCAAAVQAVCDAFGGIDVLVSNAGGAAGGAIHTPSGESALRHSLDSNLMAHQRVARPAAEAMIDQGCGGTLLFNAARSAFYQGPAFGPYAIPKAALVALMRQYAVDLGRHGIRSNAVNADRIRTQMSGDGVLDRNSDHRELQPSQYFRSNLLRREATPDLIADAFVYLARAAATTGCVITVDGGNPAAFPR